MTDAFEKAIPDPQLLAWEADKTARAAVIGKRSGRFWTPSVLGSSGGVLTTERINGVIPLRNALHIASPPERRRLASAAGLALGEIHRHLDVPVPRGDNGWNGRFVGPDLVTVHGDFGMNNIQVHRQSGQLVILDWAAPAWATNMGQRASSHWDLSLFLVDMNYQRPADPLGIPGSLKLADDFLMGYQTVRPLPREGLHRSLRLMTSLFYIHAATGPHRLARLPSSVALLVAGSESPIRRSGRVLQ